MHNKANQILHQIHRMGSETGDCLELLQNAFIKNSLESVQNCRNKLDATSIAGRDLEKRVKGLDEEERKTYGAILSHILSIYGCLGEIAATLETKIKDKVLFSDRAITEISFLLQNIFKILQATGDLVLVKNPVLCRYIIESESMVSKMTLEYATHHEERLIEGLCQPVASALFLRLLDCFKGITREAKNIAEILAQ